MPYTYNFQGLHDRLKELVHKIGIESSVDATPELDQLERELDRIHRELARIESQFAPSVMRKFFDHIKRQDEKILTALLKFYLQSKYFEQDTLDKLDILFTRLAETQGEDGRGEPKDPADLFSNFKRLSQITDLPPSASRRGNSTRRGGAGDSESSWSRSKITRPSSNQRFTRGTADSNSVSARRPSTRRCWSRSRLPISSQKIDSRNCTKPKRGRSSKTQTGSSTSNATSIATPNSRVRASRDSSRNFERFACATRPGRARTT